MNSKLPRIASVTAVPPSALTVRFEDGADATVELAGWIATGGALLAPLRDSAVFATARPELYGAAVAWGEEDGDLAIDAHHLSLIAAEQRPFGPAEAAAWQKDVGLSNNESADFLGVSLSTWNAYKAGAAIPVPVALACRATQRDPILIQAHFRPRKTGRPRRSA